MERLSVSERNELWDLYEAGESQRSISRRLGRSPSTVRTQLVSGIDASVEDTAITDPYINPLRMALVRGESCGAGIT